MSVCVGLRSEHFTDFVSLLICMLLWEQEDKKRPDERCCAKYIDFFASVSTVLMIRELSVLLLAQCWRVYIYCALGIYNSIN